VALTPEKLVAPLFCRLFSPAPLPPQQTWDDASHAAWENWMNARAYAGGSWANAQKAAEQYWKDTKGEAEGRCPAAR
jgi:hypothetical protein